MLDERVIEVWDEVYRSSADEDYLCRVLIPSVTSSEMELTVRPNFLLSQAIAGHGAFNSFLHRIRKRNSPTCKCCNAEQTPAHVFRDCNLYADSRLNDRTDEIAMENVRSYMITTMCRLWLQSRKKKELTLIELEQSGEEEEEGQGFQPWGSVSHELVSPGKSGVC